MPSVALSRLDEMLGWATGFYFSGVNTGTSSSAVTDADIARYDVGQLNNRWVLITSGNRAGESRRILSTTSTTSTLVAALSGALANADTFVILPFDPELGHAMLQQAMRTLYSFDTPRGTRGLYLNVKDETLVIDQLLTNFSLETFSTTFTGWDNIGTPALSQNTTNRVHGTYSGIITASGATEGIEQNVWSALDAMRVEGKTLHVRGWVYSAVVLSSRLRVTFDGSTYTNSSWHNSQRQWEGPNLQTIDVAIPANPVEATISCEVTDGNTGVFDLITAWVDPINEYALPTSIIGGPYRVLYQYYEKEPEGLYVPYVSGAPAGRVLRIEGAGRLTVPTTLTGTVELDENRAELVVAQAAVYLYQNPAWAGVGDAAQRERLVRQWQERVAELKRAPGIGMLFPGADEHDYWSVPPRDTRQLVLYR